MNSWKISSLTNRIRRSFSEAASQYDIFSSLQKEIGRELIKKMVPLPSIRRILDIGSGTGYLTAKAKFFFPESSVVGLDSSQGMLLQAKEKHENISWVLADASRLPMKDQAFDLVCSNLAYQWVEDLPGAFAEVKRVLSSQGHFAATLFGYHTCQEFFSSLESAGIPKQNFRRLVSIEEVKAALNRSGFSQVQVEYERIHIQFKDLWDLLGWLKTIGANQLSTGEFLGPQALKKANEYCLKHYPYHEGVQMTFEVIWIKAHA